jgi:hypothetical protein
MDPQYQMDILNFEEKISLAKLEVKKAEERVTEIEYRMARYRIEFFQAVMRQEQAMAAKQQDAVGCTPPPVVS